VSATDLVLHHRYRDHLAYDWSRHNNHGAMVGVPTGTGSLPNVALFGGGADRIEVAPSDTLRDFGELRLRVVFRAGSDGGGARRYNLVEGEFSFALFIEPDRSLMGTINSPTASWIGPTSAPGLVRFDQWHVADFLHDGVSHGRLYLDGALVGERWDMAGPLGNLGGRGVWIGHWPGDDRYTFVGQLAEVELWKHDPRRDGGRVVDDCCIDEAWIDERAAEARRAGWTGAAARSSFATFFDHCRAAAAEVRDGDAARSLHIRALTQQALDALATRDTSGLEATLSTLLGLVRHQLGPARVDVLGHELLDLLRATPVGSWMGTSDAEALAFFTEVVGRTCLDDLVPRPPDDDRRPDDDDRLPPGRHPGDPATDHEAPPDPPLADEQPEEPPPGESDDERRHGRGEEVPRDLA
jgi:hypothetical protein